MRIRYNAASARIPDGSVQYRSPPDWVFQMTIYDVETRPHRPGVMTPFVPALACAGTLRGVPLLLELRSDSGGDIVIEIDHSPAILRFPNARARLHQRLQEASAGDGDVARIHAE